MLEIKINFSKLTKFITHKYTIANWTWAHGLYLLIFTIAEHTFGSATCQLLLLQKLKYKFDFHFGFLTHVTEISVLAQLATFRIPHPPFQRIPSRIISICCFIKFIRENGTEHEFGKGGYP